MALFDFRKVLFSMAVRQVKKLPPRDLDVIVSGSAHYKKDTRYTIDHQFADHLKICPVCRDQLLSSLRETYAMIESGQFWE